MASKNTNIMVAVAPAEDVAPTLPAREYLPYKPAKDPVTRYFGTAHPEVDAKQDVNNLITRLTRWMGELLPRIHALEAGRPDPINENWTATYGYSVKEAKAVAIKLASLLPAAMEVFLNPKPARKSEED